MLPDFEQDDFVTGEFIWLDLIIVYRILKSFSVLMLLVVWQKEQLVCKNPVPAVPKILPLFSPDLK